MRTLKQVLNVIDKKEMLYIYVGDSLKPIAMLRADNVRLLGLNGIIENMSAGVDDDGVPYIAVTLKANTYC